MPNPIVDFWYEYASPYSFLAAERIEALAEERQVALRWRPFLLGVIFKKQGFATTPFNVFPDKGRYMWRDVERWCDRMGIPVKRPEPFPQSGLLASRVALALPDDARPAFTKALFRMEFCDGADIADEAVGTMRCARPATSWRPPSPPRRPTSSSTRCASRPTRRRPRHLRRADAGDAGRRAVLGQRPPPEALDWAAGRRVERLDGRHASPPRRGRARALRPPHRAARRRRPRPAEAQGGARAGDRRGRARRAADPVSRRRRRSARSASSTTTRCRCPTCSARSSTARRMSAGRRSRARRTRSPGSIRM